MTVEVALSVMASAGVEYLLLCDGDDQRTGSITLAELSRPVLLPCEGIMRCVIARYPFGLTKSGVLASMKGITPELITGESVTIGRRRCPVKQVGQVITRQDRRDFTGGEVIRATTRLGFTCHAHPDATPVRVPSLLQSASAVLGAAALDG